MIILLQLIVVSVISRSEKLERERASNHKNPRVKANWHVRAGDRMINTVDVKGPINKVTNVDLEELWKRPRQRVAHTGCACREWRSRGSWAARGISNVLNNDQRIQGRIELITIGVDARNVENVAKRASRDERSGVKVAILTLQHSVGDGMLDRIDIGPGDIGTQGHNSDSSFWDVDSPV